MIKFDRYKRYTSFENALVFIFILIVATVLFSYFKKYEDVIKTRVAYEQLYQINTAIVIYTMTKGRFPEDIKQLITENMITISGEAFFNKKYIEGLTVDSEGFPVDPWGKRYRYDKAKGLVFLEKK